MTSPLHHLKRACLWFAAIAIMAVFGPGNLSAQEFRIDQFNAIDLCSGILTDEGGSAGNTTAGTTNQITICSNSGAPSETHVSLVFNPISIDGFITVYDSDMVDPTAQIGNPLDASANGTLIAFEATALNATGCLTVVFESNGVTPGFEAAISCIRACQPVIANLASSDPMVMPADTGYIDVCIGQEITFNGEGIFPQNGAIYNQSNETSLFEWNFDNGETSTDQNATTSYDEPGGYTVQLFITDAIGCTSSNLISQRVRVSPMPVFNLQNDFDPVYCADDTITLSASTQFGPNGESNIFVTTNQESFGASQQLADTTFLPDGDGVSYETSLTFNNFEPGQVLTNIEDIESICMNMEHSYAGDLDLSITCPNGSEVIFIDQSAPGLFSQYFGIPVDVDSDLSPGIGFDYCFVPGDPSLLTIAETAMTVPIGGAESFPPGDYGAVTDWSALIGCPLNGDWTLNITDQLASDNGYIFSWGITFNDDLFADLETFTVEFDEAGFLETDDLISYEPNNIVALVNAGGIQEYTYQVTDAFGCVFDTTLTVETLPISDPDCYDCQPLLISNFQLENAGIGQEVQTELAEDEALFQDVAFRTAPVDEFSSALYPSMMEAYMTSLDVNSVSPATISDANSQVASVCVTLEAASTAGISLFLRAPDGNLLELSSNNGAGSNYTQTCFTPDAATAITAGTSPFTGEFLPEGDFTSLNGVSTVGSWTLLAWDDSGSDVSGTFVSWSITLVNENEITYVWAPDNGTLSCTDCPDPIITVDGVTDTYSVTATDSYGCSETGEVMINSTVELVLEVGGTDVTCNGDADGTAFVTISGGLEPYSILWSNEETTETITNLGPGEYTVTVTDVNDSMAVATVTITEPDLLEFVDVDVTDVDCNGNANGSIAFVVVGGTPPYTIDGGPQDMLAGGTYEFTVIDSNMCVATIAIDVDEPDAIVIEGEVTDVTCGGDEDGAIDITVTGGTGDYTYEWSNEAETEDLEGLDGGEYTVTVTDENGCTAEATYNVDEASDLEASLLLNDVACFGDSTGSIDLTVEGGVPPYTYEWSNGATTEDLINIPAGTYTGTATDAAGCTISTPEIIIGEPEELTCEVEVIQEPDMGDNGALMANAEGGTGDYSYEWSNGETAQSIDGLTPGDYCVTITDENGCTTECCATLEAFAIVGDFVFFDEDRDGIQDLEDDGIANATVIINSVDGTFSETTTTDADGFYSFLVAPGDYTLTFANPGGLSASPANQGGDDELDSDISQITLTTGTITLDFDEVNNSIDAGFFDPCDPGLTSAGTIADDQELCGPGNAPAQLVQVTPATGGTGVLNYIWMMTTGDPMAPIQNWTPIQNTNSINYQPGVLYETTYFTRCVRQDECPYIESNIVMIEVGDDAPAEVSGPQLVCEGETVTYAAVGATAASNINWSVNGSAQVIVNANNTITVSWPSFGNFTVTLTNTENGCTASNFLNVSVSSNPANCVNSLNAPSTNVNTISNSGVVALAAGPLSRVFPNPAVASEVQLQLLREATVNGQTVQVEMFNATGSRVASQLLEAGPQQIKLTAFAQQPAGLYLVRVTQDGQSETHRVVIR
ncbi:hypothetical protein CEQ90_10635 [Lewinellaceae bacterium SD302]|nr:hypothetical protein CEQ90_10635 [Lewinellaceae bacterium SD302]